MADQILDWLSDLDGIWLFLGVFVLGFGEAAILLDLIIPGEAGMVIAGAVAARADHGLLWLVPPATIGAFAGDSFSYWLGHKFGRSLVTRWEPVRRHLEDPLDRAQRYFENRGGQAVFVARWVGSLRAVVPFVAGSADMPYRRFAAWDAPACVIWTTTMLTIGYLFGSQIADVIDRAGLFVSVAVVVVLVVIVGVRILRARRVTSS